METTLIRDKMLNKLQVNECSPVICMYYYLKSTWILMQNCISPVPSTSKTNPQQWWYDQEDLFPYTSEPCAGLLSVWCPHCWALQSLTDDCERWSRLMPNKPEPFGLMSWHRRLYCQHHLWKAFPSWWSCWLCSGTIPNILRAWVLGKPVWGLRQPLPDYLSADDLSLKGFCCTLWQCLSQGSDLFWLAFCKAVILSVEVFCKEFVSGNVLIEDDYIIFIN